MEGHKRRDGRGGGGRIEREEEREEEGRRKGGGKSYLGHEGRGGHRKELRGGASVDMVAMQGSDGGGVGTEKERQ